MKVHLVTLAAFPYTSAESIHLAMFSKAMSVKCDYTLVTPLKPWRKTTWSYNIKKIYDLENALFKQKKFLQISKNGADFINKAINFAKNENALIYARQYCTIVMAVEKQIDCVLELHNLPDEKIVNSLKEYFNQGYLKKIIVISKALKRDILKLLCEVKYDALIYVAPDAADESKFKPSFKLNDKIVVGYIGSAYKGKGAEIIFPLARCCPNINFIFYGVKQGSKEIEYLGEPPSNLTLKGKILYSQVPMALKSFDIALLPNQMNVIVANGDNIGLYTSPMKLFEYMAAGKAIIASNIDILKEILNEDNSVLVDYEDIEKWEIALNELYQDKNRIIELSKKAHRDFIKCYTYNARANNILSNIV